MIKNLMYKEFRLTINPWSYLWLMGASMMLTPSMPFSIAMGYNGFFFLMTTIFDKANRDVEFAVSLPVSKAGIVTARTCTTVIVQAAQLVVGMVVAVIRYWIYSTDNQAGMNANLAFFGVMLAMYAVFNLIYLPGSYKRAYRVWWPLVGGLLVSWAFGGAVTSLVAFVGPLKRLFNDRGLGNLGPQSAVFAAGIFVYAGFTFLAHRKAVSNFAEVDL